MHRRVLLIVIGIALQACGPDTHKPSGTAADPVTVCEESAQVCRLDGAKLGVCTPKNDGKLACTSQH